MYLSRIGRDNLFIEGIVLLILLLLFYKVYNGKRFTIYLFIFSFMIRLGVSLMNNVEPVSDFAVMYNAAQYIKDGGKTYKILVVTILEIGHIKQDLYYMKQ